MRKILIVEDEDMLRESYVMILSTEPYTVHSARNGLEGLELCKQNTYDLILLDMMMPVMDGLTFLKKFVRRTKNPSKVVLLTNLTTGPKIEAALQGGAQGHLLKAELSPQQLVTAVRYEVEAV